MKKKLNNQTKGYLRTVLVLQLVVLAMGLSSFAGIPALNSPDQLPVYKKGEEAMYKELMENIYYPQSARRANISGTVYVSFRVNENGNVEDVVSRKRGQNHLEKMVIVGYTASHSTPVEPVTEANSEMEKEAIKVVEKLGKFIPAQKNGKPVSVVLTLPIQFIMQ